jgi:DNA (cytosine-5)-methyltransferase 1
MAGKVSGVIGGPPCQTFSLVGLRTKRLNDRDGTIAADQRTWLPVKMAEIIAKVRPEFCVMENVPSFMSALGGKVHESTRKIIQDAGYSVTEVKIRAERHGTPQLRTRYVLVGIKNKAVRGKRRAEELLRDLAETIDAGTQELIPLKTALQPLQVFGVIEAGRGSEYQRSGDKETWNHYAREHNPRDRGIYAALKPGETAGELEARAEGSIPYDLSSFHDKYRKLDPQKPSPTIPAHLSRDANSFVLHEVNRGLTPREAATIQGFPVDYMFLGEQTHQFRQVGNAVPPPVAKMVAELVRSALKQGKSRKWKPTLVAGRGKAPSKQTLVLRKELMRLKEAGKEPTVAEFLHWAARRLQTPKVDLRATVYREYRKILRHG